MTFDDWWAQQDHNGITVEDLRAAYEQGKKDAAPRCKHGFRGPHATSTEISGKHEHCPGPTDE